MKMTLIKNGYSPLNRTFNNLFDELFNEFPVITEKASLSLPQANVTETVDGYHVELNVPGRNKEDFKVNIDNGLLTISYEKKEETKSEGSKSVRKEFTFESFKRSFSLDDKIDAANIQAKYENGLLKFYLPKKAEVKEAAKQITIQ